MPKVMFAIPPANSDKGFATTNQNRQYQYFKDPTFIYPVIPAIFMSMLFSESGNQVVWLDAVAENMNAYDFGKTINGMAPEFVVFEANTMLINKYYEFINGIKENMPNIKIILCGEHVTAREEECRKNCKADYFIKGGKWYYDVFKIIMGKDWGKERPLPHINRNITRWWLYAYKNGNYKYVPATYMMAAQDCWYRPKHKDGSSAACTFCTWDFYHPNNVIRTVNDYFSEVENLVQMGFKEFFDDSGTFPVGKWLKEFCARMTEKCYEDDKGNVKSLSDLIAWGCNMRFGGVSDEDLIMMRAAGCRFILWGFESANESTWKRLKKGYDKKKMMNNLIVSSKVGIWNHLTVMYGYPWETLEEEKRTYKMVKWLLLNDIASSAQATVFMPYPGTPAFDELKKEGLILNEDWEKWDMTNEVVKLKHDFSEILKLQKKTYDVSFHPKFMWHRLKKIRTKDDMKFYFRLSKKVVDRFGNVYESAKV